MPFVRAYLMIARDGEAAVLEQALHGLAAAIAPLQGCAGVELLRDLERPERFTFLERWASREAQTAAGKALGKDAFAPVMAALSGPPEAASLEPVVPPMPV